MTDQEILNNAPEGATHFGECGGYYKSTESCDLTFVGGRWEYSHNNLLCRSLADIRRIVELGEAVEAVNEMFGGEDL